MRMIHRLLTPLGIACLAAGALLTGGCTGYRPDPPNLQGNAAEWRELSLALVPPGKSVSWEHMRDIGLLLNPDLNKARLKCLSSQAAARYAGLWEDPSLSLDAARYLKGLQYDRSAGLGLSIPVSGRTGIERKVAELYSTADRLELLAQENAYLMRLRSLYFFIRIAHTKLNLIHSRLKQASEEKENILRLCDLGEAGAADRHAAAQRHNDLIKELQELENAHLNKHLELLNLLGLHPSVGEVEIAGALPEGVPSPVELPSESKLMAHPRLQAALCTYQTSEEELRLQIRKQYPDLSLTPGLSHEEGDNKFALEVGFTLPLWNRNREAIARAESNRTMNKQNAVDTWHELLSQAHALGHRQKLARQHCRNEYERLAALRETAAQQEQLFELGELDLPTLAATRHETYARRLAYLDCLAELLEIQVALQYL